MANKESSFQSGRIAGKRPLIHASYLFVCGKPNQSLELTAVEHRGSARKGKEELALSGLGKRLPAAVQVGR
jgi:hypothetical protein